MKIVMEVPSGGIPPYSNYFANVTEQKVPPSESFGFEPNKFILSLTASGAVRSYVYDKEKNPNIVNVYTPSGYVADIAISPSNDITSVSANGIGLKSNSVQNVSVIAVG